MFSILFPPSDHDLIRQFAAERDAAFFDIYDEVIPESDLAEALQYMVDYNYTMYEYYYFGPNDYDEWSGLENGKYYVYIAGFNEDTFVITGNYSCVEITVNDYSEASINKLVARKLKKTSQARRHHKLNIRKF